MIDSLENDDGSSYSDPQSTLNDPPDCVARDNSGKLVGIEISEFVDLKTVRDAQHNKAYPKYWDKQEIIERTQPIILKKDRKKFHGGPYSKNILIIFTDETFLDPDDAIQYLKQHEFKSTNQIDEIYFLLSYDPRHNTYPYVKLKKSDNIRVQGTA